MKTINLFIPTITAIALTSCVSTFYYQVYKVNPDNKTMLKDNLLVYEDENCKVSYNLWGDGGNIGFRFFNKTEKNIYLNLDESFFVINGTSYNYYQNRVFTNSKSLGTSVVGEATASRSMTGFNYLNLIQTNRISATNSLGVVNSSSYSVSYNEEKIVCIPSMTSKVITEYSINQILYRDCDLFKYPEKKEIKTKSFMKSDSPFVFSNRILYTVGQAGNQVKFENEFYVSEITNYPDNEITETKFDEYCGQKNSFALVTYFKNVSPDKFFIKYSKGQDSWEH